MFYERGFRRVPQLFAVELLGQVALLVKDWMRKCRNFFLVSYLFQIPFVIIYARGNPTPILVL